MYEPESAMTSALSSVYSSPHISSTAGRHTLCEVTVHLSGVCVVALLTLVTGDINSFST